MSQSCTYAFPERECEREAQHHVAVGETEACLCDKHLQKAKASNNKVTLIVEDWQEKSPEDVANHILEYSDTGGSSDE